MIKNIPESAIPELVTKTDFIDSRFVEIKSNDCFNVEYFYKNNEFVNAIEGCYVREEVYDKLKIAATKLDTGYKFRIFDAWRPLSLQQELYENYSQKIINDLNLKNETDEYKEMIIKKYVSKPSLDTNIPPVHTTGGAIDISIEDENGNLLDMGTSFDEFSEKTHTCYYELNNINSVIKNNRRILYNIMLQSGFTNLNSEWWHYDYGDMFWSYYKDKPAIYKGVFRLEDLNV